MRRGARWVTVLLMALVLILPGCDTSAYRKVRKAPAPVPAATATIYLGTADGVLAALDVSDGRPHWTERVGGAARIIAAGPELVYAAMPDGTIAALRVSDGTMAWRVRAGSVSWVTLAAGELVLLSVSGAAAGVRALDMATGATRWQHSAAEDDAITVDGAFVYVAHNMQTPVDGPTDGFLFALRLADGSEAWRFETGGETLGTPVVAFGAVYAPSSRGLFALNASTGTRLWYAATGAYNGVPASVGRDVYVTTASEIIALSSIDGHEVWRTETHNEIMHTALVGGTLHLATYGRLLALDAATGAQQWSFTATGPLSSPLLLGGVAYVTDGARALHALDANAGRERWHSTGMAPVAATDEAVYAVQGGDTLVALAAADGVVRWRYRATGGIQPPVVAI